MKQVYTGSDPVSAHLIREMLDGQGITAVVQDERLFSVRGEMPVVYPSVWVRDEDETKARELITEHETAGAESQKTAAVTEDKARICEVCGEPIEEPFTECWRCSEKAGKQAAGGEATEASAEEGNLKIPARAMSPTAAVILLVLLAAFAFTLWTFYNRMMSAGPNDSWQGQPPRPPWAR